MNGYLHACSGPRVADGNPHGTRLLVTATLLWATLGGCSGPTPEALELNWQGSGDRPWAGSEIWANRLQDWEVRNGKLRVTSSLPMRTAHVLTHRMAPSSGSVKVTLTLGLPEGMEAPDQGLEAGRLGGAAGLLLGAGGPLLDYRRAALIHNSPGPGGGVFAGVDGAGRLVVTDFSDENRVLAMSEGALLAADSVQLQVEVSGGVSIGTSPSQGDVPALILRAVTLRPGGDTPVILEMAGLDPSRLEGGLALASHGGTPDGEGAWFSAILLEGAGVEAYPHRRLGPILGTQYTLSEGTLTLTAQLMPISPLVPGPGAPGADTVFLECQGLDGSWIPQGAAPVVAPGYTATFRIPGWSRPDTVPFRIRLSGRTGEIQGDFYSGTVRPDTAGEAEFVVAAFTGNHNVASPGVDGGTFDWERNVWFPHEDIVTYVRAHGPDFLFFSGDQVYEGASPTRADFDHPWEDYLYKWYLWMWAFRDLTAEIPSVAIPDDHDVFHGNVWGAGGRATPAGLTGAEAQDQGGYRLPADWVNMVQRTQASHLPEPWAPASSDQGIEAYFTEIRFGGVSFAVLEDRKFKSPPKLLIPEADVWNGWAQNPDFDPRTRADPPGASLLGKAQEDFLEAWAADWSHGTWMKVVLSQTIFANVATIPAEAASGSVIPSLPIPEPGAYVSGDKMAADMDSNGWPPSGRNRALRAMRKGFAVHLAGDQHLASTIQYGVDGFRDGPFALCVPSVANFWPRRWYPPEPGLHLAPGAPPYAGDFLDGFGNPMTVFAVSNPARWGREPAALHDRAPGYGIARFSRGTRDVSLEAWPRWADPTLGDSTYPGWPVRFRQEEGYGGDPVGFLPTLVVSGLSEPVVQVVSELGGDIIYTIRARSERFTPWVFQEGSYAVTVGEPGTGLTQTFLGLRPTPDSARAIEVRFQEEME